MKANKYGFDYMQYTAYSFYIKNNSELLQSASGGAATALAELILKEHGRVFGVMYSQDFKSVEYCCIDNISDLQKIKGSKYIYSSKTMRHNGLKISVYEVVKNMLSEGLTCLFIGLGCDVFLLQQYLKRAGSNTENLYTVSLICHGPTYPVIAEQYVDYLEHKYKAKVVSFNVRYKEKGWELPYLHAEFSNGKTYKKIFYDTEYAYAFNNYSRKTCYNCKFKGNNHPSDIIVGDYWGIDRNDRAYNKNGVSAIIVKSEKGRNLIEKLQKNPAYFCDNAEICRVLDYNPMFYQSRELNPTYEKFKENIEKIGLVKTVKREKGLKGKLVPLKRWFRKVME